VPVAEPDDRTALRLLARAHGVQTSYVDATGRRRAAPRSSLLAVLRLLGAPVERPADARGALREHTREHWRRVADPVALAPDGSGLTLAVRLPRGDLPARVTCRLLLERGQVVERAVATKRLPVLRETRVDGERFVELALRLSGPWPLGYHRFEVEAGPRRAAGAVIAAPRRTHGADTPRDAGWGTILPLYALHGETSWGAGSYADLARLVDWTADRGGRYVGTLPLLPTFLDMPFEPSPYMPASRLLWNEFHLAIDDVPELQFAAGAQALLRSRGLRRRLARLRAEATVDYRAQARLQRSVLEPLCVEFFSRRTSRREAFRRFLRAHPEVEDYGRFRATIERLGRPWQRWPARLSDGRLRPGDYASSTQRYHAFVQWLAAEQLHGVARRARDRGVRLCLDLPLGVHPGGYDVWRERELFAVGASAGAPPDAFFTRGQNWCLPPIRPERSRAQGHRYLAACLRHHMQPAGMLRIDHVMSLHRLFWIPDGHEPQAGVYVRYPLEELYAVLCLESWRHGCVVVGEDLGTVPRDVRPAMRRHGLSRTSVLQYGRGSNPRRPLASMTIEGVAGLHTHDMPTFAAFWRGTDIGRRTRLGHLSRPAARRAHQARERMKNAWLRDLRRGGWLSQARVATADALRGCLAFLADSAADVVLVDLEDLWGETRPQNVPGTTTEWPNWRRKTRYPLEVFATMPRVLRVLTELHRRRTARR
jgi:4-alpha-glucanotransferase